MLTLNQRLGPVAASDAVDTLTLDYQTRTRGRFKAVSDAGREVGLFLDRGPVLRHGDGLTGEAGQTIRVQAADEPVVTARLEAGLPLARLSYHLGNRHVQLAIGVDAEGTGWVRFPPDHVLEALAERLGARLEHHAAPFDPEPGAYARAGEGGHHHGHAHAHDHPHGHHHGHDHAH